MIHEVKQIIEEHIDLIEAEEWDTFFETVQDDWVPQIVNKVAKALNYAGIEPLTKMTFIPEGYFYLSGITEYKVLDNIRRICYKAFEGSDVEKVTISSSVYDVNSNAFTDCDYLETVVFEEGTEYIDDSCFYSCDVLNNVILPRSLKRLGHNVFNRCDSLSEIHYRGLVSEWNQVSNHEFITEGSYVSKIVCADGTINL